MCVRHIYIYHFLILLYTFDIFMGAINLDITTFCMFK